MKQLWEAGREWSCLPWDQEGSLEDRELDGFRYLKARVASVFLSLS